jgi:outer membrane biosynthesis protein TonB
VNKIVEKSTPIELKSTEQDSGKKTEPAQKQQKPQPPPQQKPQPPPQQKSQPPPQQKQQPPPQQKQQPPPPQQKPQQQQQQQKQQKESKENLAAQKSQKPEAAASSSNSKGPMKYLITVKTGNKTSAGTDSNVTLTIFGTKTSLQSLRLDAEKSTKKKKNLFEKGNVDEFEITGNDVGKVRLMR